MLHGIYPVIQIHKKLKETQSKVYQSFSAVFAVLSNI